jgi:signal transduction histidine kinase
MTQHPSPRDFLKHGLIVVAIDTLIAACLTLARPGSTRFVEQFVYAQAIGLITWMLIDFGRFAVQRRDGSDAPGGWPAGWRGIALPVFGVVVGNLAGGLLADFLLGRNRWTALLLSPVELAGHLILYTVLGASVSYFFWATGRGRYLVDLVAAKRREAAEAQLMLLQSQLEPHMLFNTLANLRVLIGSDPARAQALLDHLIAFLRSTLAASRAQEHSLAAEFERTADYLALMKIRMGERLSTELHLPPELAAIPVPTLLLQPLVENAIKHGLEPNLTGGRLSVIARMENEQLIVSVRDTGLGLARAAPTGGDSRFGLAHVRQRLSTRYSAAAAFSLEPADSAEQGTLATVRIPLKATP